MYLLYHESCKPVGRALGKKLKELRPHGVHYGHRAEISAGYLPIIRYGHAGLIPGIYGEHEVLQRLNAIRAAQSKFRSLQIMQLAGVNVPPHMTIQSLAQHLIRPDASKMYFLRTHHHTRGEDIQVVRGGDIDTHDYPSFDYAVEYVPSHKEYRVHVFDGRVLFCQKKVFDQELFDASAADFDGPESAVEEYRREAEMIRNYEHGYKFIIINDFQHNVPTNVITQALRAVNALGLDFGAVDVSSLDALDSGRKRQAIVWEVNTAPALETDRALTLYAEAILNHNWSPRSH